MRSGADLPPAFADVRSLSPEAHIDMQAAVQPFVDGAISKTTNLPRGFSVETLEHLINRAYAAGLKGLTVFPEGSPVGEVLVADDGRSPGCDAPRCAVT